MTKNISSLSSSDKEFDIKLLSEQVSNEAIKRERRGKSSYFIYDDFNFNSNQYLVQK